MSLVMQCGHVGVSWDVINKRPACPICIGLHDGAETPMYPQPDLSGRAARCFCGTSRPSWTLPPFFEYRPDEASDGYQCGCQEVRR